LSGGPQQLTGLALDFEPLAVLGIDRAWAVAETVTSNTVSIGRPSSTRWTALIGSTMRLPNRVGEKLVEIWKISVSVELRCRHSVPATASDPYMNGHTKALLGLAEPRARQRNSLARVARHSDAY
jgi:hypothetical protein